MKGNWKKPFFSAFFCILILEGIGASLTYQKHQAVSKQLDQTSVRLQSLQNENASRFQLNQLEAVRREYLHEAEKFTNLIHSLQFPLRTTTPQAFQDKLRDRVSLLTINAKNFNVQLPPKFYLGFDNYRSALPSQHMVSELDRELNCIFSIVNQLIEMQIIGISVIYRFPVSESLEIKKRVFDICFVSDQQAFRNALGAIFKFPHLCAVEALQVVHTQIPPKKENDAQQDEFDDIGKTIKPLFEKEKLMITLRIAMLNLPPIEETLK